MPSFADSSLDDLLVRVRPDDLSSRNEVLARTMGRLEAMVRARLQDFPGVRRFEEVDDVLQGVLTRMDKALQELPVQSAADFFRLAANHLRHHLIDLFRHYRNLIRKYQTPPPDQNGQPQFAYDPAVTTWDPSRFQRWEAFHQQVEQLSEDERETFDLMWYHGFTKPQIALLLEVSERTVHRRWTKARLRLSDLLGGQLPD